jgi:hypothetical protein
MAPGIFCRVGRVERFLDVSCSRASHFAKGFAIDWAAVDEIRTFDWRYPFATDEIFVPGTDTVRT